MRYLLPLILLGCSTSAEDDLPFDTNDWQPRDAAAEVQPPPELIFEVTGGGWGGDAVFSVSGAASYEQIRVMRSAWLDPDGTCFPAMGGACFDLAMPLYYTTTINTEFTGEGTRTLPVAPWFPESGVCFQAFAWRGGDSTVSDPSCIFVGPDSDGDGVVDGGDICDGHDDNLDDDEDGVPNGCDPCPADPEDDSDGDGVCDSFDICPDGDDALDGDGDGIPDACDPCPDEEGDGCVADNPECSDYTTMDDEHRNVTWAYDFARCDSGLSPGWYRFEGSAGTHMPEFAPDTLSCGTHAPGWLDGSAPLIVGDTESITVCYHWSSDTCNWSHTIDVTNCGPYNVYNLISTPWGCSGVYCGED